MSRIGNSALSLAVEPRRRACVLDTSLALSPYGLLLAQRLSAEFELWLVRELWQILDNVTAYVERPALLGAIAVGGTEAANGAALGVRRARAGGVRKEPVHESLLREAIQQWEVARGERDLAGLNVYWMGDHLRDSLLPAGLDPQLATRFEALGRSLDARVGAAGDTVGPVSGLTSCVRDAVALTVALSACRAFVLTVLDDAAVASRRRATPEPRRRTGAEPRQPAEPQLCAFLARWGIPCSRVDERSAHPERELLEPLLRRAGVAELGWAGLSLAAVHVVARRAAAIPTFGTTVGGGADDPLADAELETDWWGGAVGFWYPLLGA